jgi:hypothetical protein
MAALVMRKAGREIEKTDDEFMTVVPQIEKKGAALPSVWVGSLS